MRIRPISEKRQALIDAKNKSSLKVGEVISVREAAVSKFRSDSTKNVDCTIESLDGGITVFEGHAINRGKHTAVATIQESDIVSRSLWSVGANPFDETNDSARPVAFTLDSILHNCDIMGERTEGGFKVDVIDGEKFMN